MSDFQGQRVLVTAGAAGLGRATALAFAKAGARVHVCDIDADALTALSEQHPDVACTLADVAEPAQVEAGESAARARGPGQRG